MKTLAMVCFVLLVLISTCHAENEPNDVIIKTQTSIIEQQKKDIRELRAEVARLTDLCQKAGIGISNEEKTEKDFFPIGGVGYVHPDYDVWAPVAPNWQVFGQLIKAEIEYNNDAYDNLQVSGKISGFSKRIQ